MTKKLILLAISVLICSLAFSQSDDRKGYIGISIGPSFPLGLYGSTDPTNSQSGYAVTGGIFEVSFAYKLGKHFGIEALIRGQRNGTDAQALADQLALIYPNINWTITSKSWGTGGLMGGLYGAFPLGDNSRTSFEMRVLFGFLTTSSPDIIALGQNVGSATYEQTSETAGSFSSLLGIGLRHDLSAGASLLFNLDYLAASPQFNDVLTVTSSNGYVTNRGSTSFTEPIATINLSVGIAFRLR